MSIVLTWREYCFYITKLTLPKINLQDNALSLDPQD